MARMRDKIVVVTGAAQGIGAAIAGRFAEEQATLALLDNDAARLERTAADLAHQGSSTGSNSAKPLAIVADVTDEAAVEDAFAQIVRQHGRVDVLVNNAGGARNAKLW